MSIARRPPWERYVPLKDSPTSSIQRVIFFICFWMGVPSLGSKESRAILTSDKVVMATVS